jgi:hypothetical protein
MNRCLKCGSVISTSKEVWVADRSYHSKCAPDATAQIGIRNLQLLNDRVTKLEELIDELQRSLKG